jgi:hypothetical protein
MHLFVPDKDELEPHSLLMHAGDGKWQIIGEIRAVE